MSSRYSVKLSSYYVTLCPVLFFVFFQVWQHCTFVVFTAATSFKPSVIQKQHRLKKNRRCSLFWIVRIKSNRATAWSCCFTTHPAEGSTWTQEADGGSGAHLDEGLGPDSGPEGQQGTGSSLQQPNAAPELPTLHRAARLKGTEEGSSVVYL